MTTATDVLRKLLDECGIEWKDGDAAYEIEWSTPDGRHCSAMYWKPTFSVLISGCTPEQAIAATLGNSRAERTCEFNIKDNMNETEGMGDVWIECSACHCAFDYFADDWLMKMSYCPSCGARKVNK